MLCSQAVQVIKTTVRNGRIVVDEPTTGTALYVKLILHVDCVVVPFHDDEGAGHEQEDA